MRSQKYSWSEIRRRRELNALKEAVEWITSIRMEHTLFLLHTVFVDEFLEVSLVEVLFDSFFCIVVNLVIVICLS